MGDEYEYDDGYDDDDGFLYVEDEYGFVVRLQNTPSPSANLQPRVHPTRHNGKNIWPVLRLSPLLSPPLTLPSATKCTSLDTY